MDKKIMLIYPPGNLYQRGEERCQSNVEGSTSTSVRACNDLGYAASILKEKGFAVFLRDYQTENLSFEEFKKDFIKQSPDSIFMSVTNGTIFQDLEIADKIKKLKKNTSIILKGALFFDIKKDLIENLNLKNIDYLIGGESEFVVGDLICAHFLKKEKIENLPGIAYKKAGKWKKTFFDKWEKNLDTLKFPDRKLMNNKLYVRPDTGEPQATIFTSRGCPSNCIYCLTPRISGRKVRKRSPQNILMEMEECYYKHKIKNFFFRADTFTIDKKWVKKLCSLIIHSKLNGKISWVANSRTQPLDEETLKQMKEAGCWLIAIGFESGSEDTLKKIKKGATIEDSYKAVKLAKQVGLKTYGFYMVGFPWETMKHLHQTKKIMFNLNTDFVELHIATPFYGTELYKIAKEENLLDKTSLGKNYFGASTIGTKYIPIEKIVKFRAQTLFEYHARPSFIAKHLMECIRKPNKMKAYLKYGFKILGKNTLKEIRKIFGEIGRPIESI